MIKILTSVALEHYRDEGYYYRLDVLTPAEAAECRARIEAIERERGHPNPPSIRQLVMEWDSATLVRGEDRDGHFVLTPRPKCDLDEEALEFYHKATDSLRATVFEDAGKVRERF